MNVLYLLNRYPKLSESFVINEIHELERRGHRVAVFSLRRPEGDVHHDEVDEIDAAVGYLPDPSPRAAFGTAGPWLADPDVLRRMVHPSSPVVHAGATYVTGHLDRFIRSLPFEIEHIHGHFLNWPKFAADYLATRYDVPWTTTIHAYGLFSDPNPELNRGLTNRMDRVITISEYNRRYLRDEVGTTSPIDVVHMGIDVEKFQPTDSVERGRILTVARFEEKKGIPYGLQAIAGLAEMTDDLDYHIVGAGPGEPVIRETIATLGLEDLVTIKQNITDAELIRELDEADLFLLPCVIAHDGDRDGIPVALMEAMAMRCIPVSTTVSGIPELITPGDSGFLAEPRSMNALADTLRSALVDRSVDRERCRQVVRKSFERRSCTESLVRSLQLS